MKIHITLVTTPGKARSAKRTRPVAKSEPELDEPATSIRDRRSYSCANCGRQWRKLSKTYRCPHCGYARKARP